MKDKFLKCRGDYLIRLLLIKNGLTYDISRLVKDVQWGGRKGSASRTIKVNLLDSDCFGYKRAGIYIEGGQHCIFYWNDIELFRGIIMEQEQSDSKTMSIEAYDNGIYMANNKDTFNYSNRTASDIFIDCCNRFQIPYGEVAETGYIIPELPKPKTTPYDVICDALSQTYKATGNRFYPVSMEGKMHLLCRRENMLQWVIESGVNLSSYNYKKSLNSVRTRLKLLSNKDEVLAQKCDTEIEGRIGVFQEVSTPDENLNKAQLNELAENMLNEKKKLDFTLKISGLGIPEIYSGIGVYIIIKELGIENTYYVDEDSHTFEGRVHTMSLTLTKTNDI